MKRSKMGSYSACHSLSFLKKKHSSVSRTFCLDEVVLLLSRLFFFVKIAAAHPYFCSRRTILVLGYFPADFFHNS